MIAQPRRVLAGLAAAGLMLLGACTSSSNSDVASSAEASVSTSSAGLSVSSSAPSTSTSTSPSSSTSSTPTPSTPVTSSSQPWPADFTPEQVAAAQSAIETYKNAVRVTDEAYADPDRADLEPFVRQYMGDPRASQVIRAAQSMASKGKAYDRIFGGRD